MAVEIVGFPNTHADFPSQTVKLPDGKSQKTPLSHNFPMVFLCFSYGFPMVFLWKWPGRVHPAQGQVHLPPDDFSVLLHAATGDEAHHAAPFLDLGEPIDASAAGLRFQGVVSA